MNPPNFFRILPAVAATVLVSVIAVGCKPASRNLPVKHDIPPFQMKMQTGADVTRETLREKVWVANFFFATCPGICKDLSRNMRKVSAAFAGDDRIRCVSFTTDPDRDTEEALRKYAEEMKAPPNWLFLRGTRDSLYPLCVQGFKLPLDGESGSTAFIIHSERFVLVDSRGRVRAYYDGLKDDDMDQLIADIRGLLK
jgi:protein SCO1/2